MVALELPPTPGKETPRTALLVVSFRPASATKLQPTVVGRAGSGWDDIITEFPKASVIIGLVGLVGTGWDGAA